MYGKRCPICGAFLDPCERCDCDTDVIAVGSQKRTALRGRKNVSDMRFTMLYL